MDFESVLQWFEGISLNWNPDLLLYRKSYFDHWKVEDMLPKKARNGSLLITKFSQSG